MKLRQELKDRADKLDAEFLDLSGRIREIERQIEEIYTCLCALDAEEKVRDQFEEEAELAAAIAALTPATTDEGWLLEPGPADLFEAEKAEAREQLEREDDASEFAEMDAEDDTFIDEQAELFAAEKSEAPADVMPESGLHDDHTIECQPFALTDAQTCEPVSPFVEPERPALNEAMHDERELTADELTLAADVEPTDAYVETTPDTLAECVPTNPDAVAERQKFNPFRLFKRETEEVS